MNKLTFNDLFPVATPDEVAARQEYYKKLMIKEILDAVKKTKLPDGSWHIHGDLDVTNCGLTLLKDLNVSIVDGYFDCSCNYLTSLEGCPKDIKRDFECSGNLLTTLKGCPKKIYRCFDCAENKLTSLEGCPTEVGNGFYCQHNDIRFFESEVRAVCNVKNGIIFV